MNSRQDQINAGIGSVVAFLSGFSLHEWYSILGIAFGGLTVYIAYKKYKEEVALKKEELTMKKEELNLKTLQAKIEAKRLGIEDN